MSKTKPDSAPTLAPIAPDLEAPRRVIVVREGNNQYTVYEETYEKRPVSRKLLLTRVPRVTAVDEVKLWDAAFRGPDGYGGAGL